MSYALTRSISISCQFSTCGERKELSVVANFSDQVPPCFAEVARPRSNMLVSLLSYLFLLQLDCIQNYVFEVLLGT